MAADEFSDLYWFVVMTHQGREVDVCRRLEDQGYRPFLPLALVERRHARRVERVERPLFPNYGFVGVTTEQPFAPICHTRGVASLLSDGQGVPVEVRPRLLRAIKARLDADGGCLDLTRPAAPPRPRTDYAPGQPLRIVEGPLAGIDGLFVAAARDRITLLLDMLGGQVLSEIAAGAVKPISPDPAEAVADSVRRAAAS